MEQSFERFGEILGNIDSNPNSPGGGGGEFDLIFENQR